MQRNVKLFILHFFVFIRKTEKQVAQMGFSALYARSRYITIDLS